MLWLAILVGTALAFAIKKSIKIAAEKQRARRQIPETEQPVPPAPTNHPGIFPQWTGLETAFPRYPRSHGPDGLPNRVTNAGFRHVPPSGLRLRPAGDNTRELVENWRRSIAGLIFLAQSNLNSARMHFGLKAYEAAVQSASTSVENIARALIHCYGGKPDENPSQEEPLRLLSRRLEAKERSEFNETINMIACIQRTETALNTTPSNPVSARILNGLRTQQTIEGASRIISMYQRIMIDHFRDEIPELLATVQTRQYGVNQGFPN